MFNSSSLLFLLLLLVSCGKGGGGSNAPSVGETEVSLSEITNDSPVPNAALNFDVNAKMINFNSTQVDKILEASDMIKKIVASDEFKRKILNHTYKGKKTFVDNLGLSNAQIYKRIIEGAEKLYPSKDNEMDLELQLYYENSLVVGYTMPSTVRIWMNTKYFNQNPSYQVTDNMMHEWLHKIGFGHSATMNSARPYSVPYAVGYMVRNMAKKL